MLPAAHVSHRTPGRLRLRIPTRRGQADFFDKLVAELTRQTDVERLEANPLTASVLLMPAVDLGKLARIGADGGLYTLAADESGHEAAPLAQQVAAGFGGLNRQLRSMTGGNLDLVSVGFLVLVAAAFIQLQRGHVLGPTSTLLWYASGLLLMSQGLGKRSRES
jgi:hypothetical protein